MLAAFTSSAGAQTPIASALAFTVSSPAKITLGTNSSVTGSAGALGNLTVGSRALVSNDAATMGKLRLRSRATVGGTCASLTQPKFPKSASCNTTDTSPSSPQLITLSGIPSSGVTFCPAASGSATALDIKRGVSQSLTVTDGLNIFDYTRVKLGASAILTITGPSDAVVLIVDSGIFKLAKNALITTDGIVPVSNVLILVGTSTPISTPRVTLSRATINGSLFATGACNIGANSIVSGQMYCGGNISLGKNTSIGATPLISTAANAITCP